MFADKVEIEVKAGKGGDGRLSFRHEKYRAKGGPDGGDGGRGGSVTFEADHNLNTLSRFKTKPRVAAEDGQIGGDNRKTGKSGADTVVKVPVGTVAYESGAGSQRAGVRSPDPQSAHSEPRLLADLSQDGQTAVIARGGRGGFGNAHFTASTRQAPRLAELGEPGEVKKLTLELKLAADVGLVGLPNAGKSTLLSVISNAKPQIGDYPFTTLTPNLGVVDFEDDSFLVADIPGLIAGASSGRGLGDEFLRHIERTAVLLHLIDASSADPVADWRTIIRELKTYQPQLIAKPQIVVLSKIDAVTPETLQQVTQKLTKATKQSVYPISAVAHRGIDQLLRAALPLVRAAREAARERQEAVPVIDELSFPDRWQVEQEAEGVYRITGEQIEGFARRSDWQSNDALQRLRDILRKTGVARELARRGAEAGATIRIGDNELEWL